MLPELQGNAVDCSNVLQRAPSNTPCYAFLSICTVAPLSEPIPKAKVTVLR